MLVIAALLAASLHPSGALEAVAAPAAHALAVPAPVAPDVTVRTAAARVVTVASEDQVDGLAQLRGRSFLRALSALSPAELRRAGRDAAVQRVVLDHPPTAADVEPWWGRLPAASRVALTTGAPQLIGNLEGIPYSTRDTANRATLARLLDASRADDGAGQAGSKTAMLGQIQAALRRGPGDPEKQLVTIDTRGAGRAAIALGDLDTASDVTVMVPGMFFTVTGQLVDWTATGADLYREQATVAPAAAVATSRGQGSGVAVLAWMGYRTPGVSNVLSLDLAKVGATRLERVVAGIDRTRASRPPRVSIVAHSYGSTTALLALSAGRVHVDSLTLFGSPGSGVAAASELAVTAGQVFVGDAHWDPVAGTGIFGHDPGASGFGSTLLDLAGGADAVDIGDVLRRPFGHNGYLKPGTASLHDVALIAVGRSDLVRHAGDDGSDGDGPPESPAFLVLRPQDPQLRD